MAVLTMTAGKEKKLSKVIHEGKVKEWVGIGWVELREATAEDREKIPEVKG